MTSVTIEIAGIPAEIHCRYPENAAFFREYVTDKPPLFTVEVSDEYLERTRAGFCRMDDARGWPRRQREDSFLENNAIHALLMEGLLAYNVLLIHGSALCMDGQAVIFTAKSGTGKSTHSRLWREAFGDRVWMINDDKPVVRIVDGQAFVYGTPWNGKHHLGTNAAAPLSAIVRLEHDETNHVEPLSQTDAYLLLIRHTYRPESPELMARTMELEKQLLDIASFWLLGCNMDPEAARVSCEGILHLH
ncbi:MAG: hypothetical protein J6Y67_04360 [Lachnospiraceae bacterium]|nr:hypothetical protein [Lachnospiraceae bacterium]